MQEAIDYREECAALAAILDAAAEEDFQRVTLFADWTIEDVIGHLHMWNRAAAITLESREKFQEFLSYFAQNVGDSGSMLPVQYKWIDEFENGLRGKALYRAWRDYYDEVAGQYQNADPDLRVAWAGPDMTARSKIIARQMETWAHGQEIFDVLGIERENTDRIRNIAHLGVTTFSWAFRNRGQEPPKPKPYVRLTAPSGVVWEWNDVQEDNAVTGDAAQFCQVVTQTRNIHDTQLTTKGPSAEQWMSIAQCFAGPPKTPPLKGARYKA